MGPGRRSGRAAAKRAQAALESTPKTFDGLDEDEPMPDADEVTATHEEGADDDDAKYADSAADEDENEGGGDGGEDEESAKEPSPPPEPVIRKRRLGRPPKNRPPDWDTLPIEKPERDPDAPPRRGRGRGRGGWRGRGRGGRNATPTTQVIDKDGTALAIVDDEVDLPIDPEGETKVDKNGHLKGGREYRCRTFTIQGRGDRLYMLSTEPARCVGFRDSYLFFSKHKRLFKVIVGDEDKKDMIDREIIPHSYKGRSIGVVTARSVFREFGARIVVGGRLIIDDYEVAQARADGVTEGELADPNDVYDPNKPYNKLQYVAWHGASQVYHQSGPSVPVENARAPIKKRVAVNNVNWQLEHALECSRFNSTLTGFRKATMNGVYNVHTNTMMYPAMMQPTNARIEQVPASSNHTPSEGTPSSTFPHLDSKIPRNFLVTDIRMELPPGGISPASYDIPFRTSPADRQASAQADFLASFQGLSAVPDDIRDLLPEDCRKEFDAAASREEGWFARWGDEKTTKARGQPLIDKDIMP